MTMMRELTLIGIRMESPNRAPVMMLRETEGYRYLPISIGSVEATSIAYAEQGLRPARPLTHDLMRDLLLAFDATIEAVEIVELRDAVFYAELGLGNGTRVSARPSDSVALAVRLGIPLRRPGGPRAPGRVPPAPPRGGPGPGRGGHSGGGAGGAGAVPPVPGRRRAR